MQVHDHAGILARTQGRAEDDKLKALHDCMLFLQADELEFNLPMANVAEFDVLLQRRSSGRVLF